MRHCHAVVVALLWAAGLAAVTSVSAQTSAPAAAPAKPLWELGAAGLGVSQQAYPGADQQVNRALVLPTFIYRGKLLRSDGDTLGLRALKTPTVELDIGFAAALGSSSNNIDARRGLPKLGTLVEFGPRIKWNLGPGPAGAKWRANFPVRGVFDLSNSLGQRGLAFEPELLLEKPSATGWGWSTSAGAVFGNRKLNDTFYGVAPQFATADRPAYEAKSGLIALRFGASASRALSPDWRLFTFARIDTVAGAANSNSPLVRQKTGGSVGVGVTYTWLRSERLAVD